MVHFPPMFGGFSAVSVRHSINVVAALMSLHVSAWANFTALAMAVLGILCPWPCWPMCSDFLVFSILLASAGCLCLWFRR